MKEFKVSKTIPVPGFVKVTRKKMTLADLPLTTMKKGNSVRLERVPPETRNAETKIKDYYTKINELMQLTGLKIEFVIALRKTPKRAEIRLWRTK